MHLAIFDLDNTLIAGDSDHAWGEFLISQKLVDADAYKRQNDQFYQDYQAGTLDIIAYQKFALAPLSKITPENLALLHKQFMREVIEPLLLPKANALIESHRQQGHQLLIITATNRFITEPIAKRLGIDHIIATEGELINGRYTGNVSGEPSFGAGKISRLQQWLKNQNTEYNETFFYSDSHNDLPLLEWSDHPTAVDPDPQLAKAAQDQGWPIISLR